MKISLCRESRAGETRVALTPDAVKALVGDGWTVEVERGAGALAHFTDDAHQVIVHFTQGTQQMPRFVVRLVRSNIAGQIACGRNLFDQTHARTRESTHTHTHTHTQHDTPTP